MPHREKFGRLVLLEKTDSDPLGDEWSAARLGPNGLDRLVSVLRFSSAVSAHADATKRLVDEARLAAQVHGSALLRVLGVGRVGQSFYVSTELAEGRTLRAILARRGPTAVLRVDYQRYVGAKIGIYNPAGVKTGTVGKLQNQELIFIVACAGQLPGALRN